MRALVGDRIVAESERATRPSRAGVVAEVLQTAFPRYRVCWDNGRTSIITPAAGAVQIVGTGGDRAVVDETNAFRAINDHIRNLGQPWHGTYDFVCECADIHCTEVLPMSGREHDLLRAIDDRFAVLPGHERAAEVVFARTDRYVLVKRPRRGASDPSLQTSVRNENPRAEGGHDDTASR